jgi:hypothetical protein
VIAQYAVWPISHAAECWLFLSPDGTTWLFADRKVLAQVAQVVVARPRFPRES